MLLMRSNRITSRNSSPITCEVIVSHRMVRNDAAQWRFKMQISTSRFLRWVFVADAATCLAAGLLMMIGSEVLAESLGLPAGLLRYAGASLLPFASVLVYLTSRQSLSPSAVWTVIVLNVLW